MAIRIPFIAESARDTIMRMSKLLTALLVFANVAAAQPLNERVLMVYHSGSKGSTAVAKYYQARRGLAANQLCPIHFSNPKVDFAPAAGDSQINWSYPGYMDFLTARKIIRGCLQKAGKETILYILLSTDVPLELTLEAVQKEIPRSDDSVCPPAAPGPGCVYHSLEGYLADIWNQAGAAERAFLGVENPYFSGANKGNYTPLQTLAEYRSKPGSKLIYSVFRLGPLEQDAKGQIDRAIETGRKGLAGAVCLDSGGGIDPRKMPLSPEGNCGAQCLTDWQNYRAGLLATAAGLKVIHDGTDDTFGKGKAIAACPDAAFYGGAYNPGAYNNAFKWVPGAIGWDMNSYRLWAAGAIAAGITVTAFPNREPFQPLLPVIDGAFRDFLQGATAGDAMLRNLRWLKWNIVLVGDPLYTPFPGRPLKP